MPRRSSTGGRAPERVGGWKEGVPTGVHLASLSMMVSPGTRAREDCGHHSCPGVVEERSPQAATEGSGSRGRPDAGGEPQRATPQPPPAARASAGTSGLFAGEPSSLPDTRRRLSVVLGDLAQSPVPLAPVGQSPRPFTSRCLWSLLCKL